MNSMAKLFQQVFNEREVRTADRLFYPQILEVIPALGEVLEA